MISSSSKSFEHHLQDLHQVFSRLRSANLKVNLRKCKFASQEISYLGCLITPEGLKADPAKVTAVNNPLPKNPDQLRSFLGLCGYYRSFIPGFSQMASSLHALLHKDASWSWTPERTAVFNRLGQLLTCAPVLRFPDFCRPFELHTDGACAAGIGVILCQRDPSNNRAYAIAYASRSLSPAERNYVVTEIEARARAPSWAGLADGPAHGLKCKLPAKSW